MAGIKGLAHIGVYTADLDASLDFYCNKLGFELFYTMDMPATRLRFVRAGGCIIELINPADYKGGRPTDGAVAHIAIEVENLRAYAAGLKAKGVALDLDKIAVLPKLFPTGSTNLFFIGPNGESLELYEYVGA